MQPSPALPARRETPAAAWIVLLVGVLAVSTSAVLIKFAQTEGVPSLVIAAVRLTLASAILSVPVLTRHRSSYRTLSRRDWLLLTISGVFLALHFATWISSLDYTSVLVSTVLVSTTPLWVSGLEVVFLKIRLSRWVVAGLVVTLVGGFLIAAGGDGSVDLAPRPVLGGVLALAGAMTVAVYMVIGRSVRGRLALLPYIGVVYGIAAVVLLGIVAVQGLPLTGYSPVAYVYMLGMALLPQLVGHSSFNFAVKFLPATYIGLVAQLEPIASSALALLLLGQVPTGIQIAASALILIGVTLVIVQPRAASANRRV